MGDVKFSSHSENRSRRLLRWGIVEAVDSSHLAVSTEAYRLA